MTPGLADVLPKAGQTRGDYIELSAAPDSACLSRRRPRRSGPALEAWRRRQPPRIPSAHEPPFIRFGAAVGEQVGVVGLAAPKTPLPRRMAAPVPARMSSPRIDASHPHPPDQRRSISRSHAAGKQRRHGPTNPAWTGPRCSSSSMDCGGS